MALRPRNILSLCAGVGGLELGIALALHHRGEAARGICYVEREAAAAASLVASMEAGWLHPAPVWSDLATFDGRPWRGLVHILASGDPCQDNSVAGKRAGADGERFLAPEVVRIARECRPDRIFRENVPGNLPEQLAALIGPLEGLGYRTAVGIFSSAETGNTMRRERAFVLAEREDGQGAWERDRNGNVYPTLEGLAEHWMAPNVPNGGRTAHHAEMTGRTAMHNGKKVQIDLEHQASTWIGPRVSEFIENMETRKARLAAIDPAARPGLAGSLSMQAMEWVGPCAMNHKGSIIRSDGKSRAALLHYQAEQLFHPPSSPDRPIAGGSMSSTASPNSNQPSAKRKLNPIFVEALMRWPTGLSGFARPETAWTPSQPRGHSFASNGVFARWWSIQSNFLALLLLGQAQEPEQMDLFAA